MDIFGWSKNVDYMINQFDFRGLLKVSLLFSWDLVLALLNCIQKFFLVVSFSQICDGVLANVMKAVYVNEHMCGISLIIA